MRVLVVGSVRCTTDAKLQQDIKAAAHDIGCVLAERNHTILVGSDDPLDVDPEVVAGADAGGKAATVEVHLMHGAKDCYVGRKGSLVIANRPHRYSDWDVTVLEVLRNDADAVIALGGRIGVIQTGIAGWMLGRPVVPIGCFDGGARTVWGYGSGERQEFYFGALTDQRIDALMGSWNGQNLLSAKSVVDTLETLAAAAAVAKTPKSVFLLVSGLAFLMLVLWVTLLSLPLLAVLPSRFDSAGARFVFLLLSVCAAGALGSMMQTLRGVRERRAATYQDIAVNGVLGMAAGVLTAALYLIAQVAITGRLEFPKPNDDYVRVALLVGVTSLFASLYLDAALARFDGLKDSIIAGKIGTKLKVP